MIEDEWLIAEDIADIARAAGATSIEMAVTEQEAIDAANLRTPAIILSDVRLLEGTGPAAVMAITAEHGPIPVIFITGTPEECDLCDASTVVMGKPVETRSLTETFKRLAPLAT